MFRTLLGISVGLAMFLGATSVRADEVKRALFVLGIHMEGAEGVAIEMIGENPKEKPGAIALMQRQLTNSIDVATVLKLPTEGLKALLADVNMEKASFADMATRMGKLRLEMQANASKSINPGAGAFFIMGIHLSGGERVSLGASGAARDDKPGTGALIERQLTRLADGAGGIMVTLKPVLELQKKVGDGKPFAELAADFAKLRLGWQEELAKQPGFGAAVAGGGKVIFSTAAKLTTTDPKDTVRTGSHAKVHVVVLKAGQTVVIDLESGDGNPNPRPGFFDTWLRLEDSTGKRLGESDDISSTNYNSRMEFTPTQDGNYRLIVTTYRAGASGDYTLTVRQK